MRYKMLPGQTQRRSKTTKKEHHTRSPKAPNRGLGILAAIAKIGR